MEVQEGFVELCRFPPGFGIVADTYAKMLKAQGFSVEQHTAPNSKERLIWLPEAQVERLRAQQRAHPERWGTGLLTASAPAVKPARPAP